MVTNGAKAESKVQEGVTNKASVFSVFSWELGWRLVCVLLKRKKQKARPRGVNLKVRWGAKVAMRYCS